MKNQLSSINARVYRDIETRGQPGVTASKAVEAVQPLKPELNGPYTLAQVIENLALMHRSQDLTWCRWVATDILERGIDALPTHD